MLLESSLSSSVETILLNASEYQDPFAAYDWMSLAETYEMIHKLPEQSQVSFLDAVPVSDAMKLDESEHPKLQVSCPEQTVMHKVSEKALTSLVYSRRNSIVRPVGSKEHNLEKCKKQDDPYDDSIVPVYNPGESTKRKNRFNNCLVYSRKEKRVKTSCDTGETRIRADGLDDASVSGHNCGETKRRGNQLDNCLVYSRRKKGGVKSNRCDYSDHVSGRTKVNGDKADSFEYRERGQIVKADGVFTGSNLYSQSKELVKSNGSFTKIHTGETKRNDNISGGLLMYSRRKQRGKSISARVDGFLVYKRKKSKANSISHVKQVCSSLEPKSIYARINGFLVYRRKKHKPNSISHVEQVCSSLELMYSRRTGDRTDGLLVYSRRKHRGKSIGARVDGFLVYKRKKSKPNSISHVEKVCSSLELKDNTQVAKVTSSSDGTNEAADCDSSDAEASETDTDTSISPFRQCKRCDKAGTAHKMLICDECEEAYHPRCCRVRVKEAAEMVDWLCRSCLKKNSLKTKLRGRPRGQKWRVTKPLGIRVGKEYQADVPDWSGPAMSDTSFVGQPLEIDESEYMHNLKKAKNGKKPRSAVNWVQCREEDRNGDKCGKWRRAPRSEVQTKDWECFCCVFWDPSHADCAAPQELETEEIMKQLKYIKMLRPRSDAKTRKIEPKDRSRSHK